MTGHLLLHHCDDDPSVQQACVKILCQEDVLEAEHDLAAMQPCFRVGYEELGPKRAYMCGTDSDQLRRKYPHDALLLTNVRW